MEFLKNILGDDYSAFETKLKEFNAANPDKQIKLANLTSGDFVSKDKYGALEIEVKGLKEQISQANQTIEGFGDVEAIKSQVADYQTKFAETEAAHQANLEKVQKEYDAKLAEMEFDGLLKDRLSGFKFTSDYAKNGIFAELRAKVKKTDDGKIIGFDDVINAIKEAQPTAFAPDDAGAQTVDFGKLHEGGGKEEPPYVPPLII